MKDDGTTAGGGYEQRAERAKIGDNEREDDNRWTEFSKDGDDEGILDEDMELEFSIVQF